jgi:hypothetical protein
MSGLFGSTPTPTPVEIPVIAEPTVMPLQDDAAAAKAKKKISFGSTATGRAGIDHTEHREQIRLTWKK